MKNNYRLQDGKVFIELISKGEKIETFIDESDFEKVNSFIGKWYAFYNKSTNKYYVSGQKKVDGKVKTIYLHRFLYDEPEGLLIDHINFDTLNNTRENTRVVTHLENLNNLSRKEGIGKSKVRNVTWCKFSKKWRAWFRQMGVLYDLGRFTTVEEASEAVRLKKEELKKVIK